MNAALAIDEELVNEPTGNLGSLTGSVTPPFS